jgi:hypothetical protein
MRLDEKTPVERTILQTGSDGYPVGPKPNRFGGLIDHSPEFLVSILEITGSASDQDNQRLAATCSHRLDQIGRWSHSPYYQILAQLDALCPGLDGDHCPFKGIDTNL